MKIKSYSLIAYLLGISTLIISCSNSGAQNPRQAQQPQPYPVLEVSARSIILSSSYPATLEGVQTIQIRPRVPGFIVEIPVNEGDLVEKGEVLFKLNDEEYRQQVQTAKVEVGRAKNELQRVTPLAKQGIISEYNLKTAKLNLQAAEAALVTAKQNLSYTTIKSPVDGVLGTIPYDIGSLVNSTITTPLTTVSSIAKMYAYFSMSERELLEMTLAVADEGGNKTLQQMIKEMPPVSFIMANNQLYVHSGNLELASGLINTSTGSAYFRAEFPNPQQILRSGGTGNVLIPIYVDSAIVIPKSATYEIQDKRFVYTLTDSNTVEGTEIETLPQSTEKLFVVTDGLNAGNAIITTGMGRLSDGVKIIPQPVNADSLFNILTVN
jgi:membrane fusion protein (multidrug efflux system)